jgi:beta-glucosidase
MHFGITDRHGRPKPPLHELQAFGRTIARVDVARCERATTRVALVVSSYLEDTHPMADAEHEAGPRARTSPSRSFVFDALEQAHVAAREADVPPAFVRERDGIDDGYLLYLVPSVKQLTAPSWLRLEELACGGATVWVSYGAGESDYQRGPWWTNTAELFGVRNELVYGLNDPIEDDAVELRFVAPLGDIAAGEVLSFAAAGGPNARAFLPVEVLDAEVVAVDARDRPAILRKRHGRGGSAGQAVLSTYPLEYLAAARARVNPEDTWRVYRALAVQSGATGPVTVPDPRVLVDGLVHGDGTRYVWLVSEHDDELEAHPAVRGGTLESLDGEPVGPTVLLAPFGVVVLRHRADRPPHPDAEEAR